MDRQELADFLRGRRTRVRPEDVGLETGPRRRTPGLRREEVARLAGMSVDYYIRLEQGRGPRPSRQILGAMARALRLSDDERDYLYLIAGEPPQPPPGPSRDVPASVLHLLERLDDTPAYVLDARYDVLAWNSLAAALTGDYTALPPRQRNPVKWFFLDGDPRAERYPLGECFAVQAVGDLRTAAARYPHDPGIASLIAELREGSPEFARLWDERQLSVRRATKLRMNHPAVGPIELHRDVLLIPDSDQQMILYTAAPGTPSAEALRLLRVVGTQDLSSPAVNPADAWRV